MSREGGSLFVLAQADRCESARCKLKLIRGSGRLAQQLSWRRLFSTLCMPRVILLDVVR
jgi:hypothetical protein